MLNTNIKSKKGFTIIEVVLVLAIAGLIFLMVFVALPALQRSQRDTQRKNDLDRLQSQLISYVSSNNRLPVLTSSSTDPSGKTMSTTGLAAYTVTLDTDIEGGLSNSTRTASKTFGQFLKNYLLTDGDTFEDPSGSYYHIAVMNPISDEMDDIFTEEADEDGVTKIAKEDYASGGLFDFDSILDDDPDVEEDDLGLDKFTRIIYVVYSASCYDDDDTPIAHYKSDGKKNFAIAMRLESGSVYCLDN